MPVSSVLRTSEIALSMAALNSGDDGSATTESSIALANLIFTTDIGGIEGDGGSGGDSGKGGGGEGGLQCT